MKSIIIVFCVLVSLSVATIIPGISQIRENDFVKKDSDVCSVSSFQYYCAEGKIKSFHNLIISWTKLHSIGSLFKRCAPISSM